MIEPLSRSDPCQTCWVPALRAAQTHRENPFPQGQTGQCCQRRILIAAASAEIPEPQRSWSRSRCNKGFGWLSNRNLTASRLAQQNACYRLTAKQLRKRCCERASWKANHDKLNQHNAALRRSQTDAAIAEYNKQGLGLMVACQPGVLCKISSLALLAQFLPKSGIFSTVMNASASGRDMFITADVHFGIETETNTRQPILRNSRFWELTLRDCEAAKLSPTRQNCFILQIPAVSHLRDHISLLAALGRQLSP